MNIWWDDPAKAHVSEEVCAQNRNEVIIKDKKGKAIGLEALGVFPEELNIASEIKRVLNGKKNEPLLLGPQ